MIKKPEYPKVVYSIPIILQTIMNTQDEIIDWINHKERCNCEFPNSAFCPNPGSIVPVKEIGVNKDIKYLCGGCKQIHMDKDYDSKTDIKLKDYGCGALQNLFYSEMEYKVPCGGINSISGNVILCKNCEAKK